MPRERGRLSIIVGNASFPARGTLRESSLMRRLALPMPCETRARLCNELVTRCHVVTAA